MWANVTREGAGVAANWPGGLRKLGRVFQKSVGSGQDVPSRGSMPRQCILVRRKYTARQTPATTATAMISIGLIANSGNRNTKMISTEVEPLPRVPVLRRQTRSMVAAVENDVVSELDRHLRCRAPKRGWQPAHGSGYFGVVRRPVREAWRPTVECFGACWRRPRAS